MIGFLGAGNMATALMAGMIAGGVAPASLMAYDISPARMDMVRAMGVQAAEDAVSLANASETTVIVVKPVQTQAVLEDLRAHAQVRDVLSVVLGWTQDMLAKALPNARGIARCMPNTPAQVGEGVIALNENHSLAQGSFDALRAALDTCGKTFVLPERLFDAVTAVSGSGPAYVYLFIEALADAAVREGLTRDMAYELAAQTVLGAAQMVRSTGERPGALKDKVASPGGSTIEALYTLEKTGFRASVMEAMYACARKAEAMSKH